jgi:predicted transcriptional regulator
MKYRSRTEIYGAILNAASEGPITSNKLLYRTYVTHAQLKNYTSILIQNKLLEYNEVTKIFRTTEKGFKFIKTFKELNDFVE